MVIDVGRSMGEAAHSEVTGLENAKKAVRLYIQQKLLFPRQDELGLVLCGTKGTNNQLNEAQDGFEHVTVFSQLESPTVKMLEKIEDIETEVCSWFLHVHWFRIHT